MQPETRPSFVVAASEFSPIIMSNLILLKSWLLQLTNMRKRHIKPVVVDGRPPRSQLELLMQAAAARADCPPSSLRDLDISQLADAASAGAGKKQLTAAAVDLLGATLSGTQGPGAGPVAPGANSLNLGAALAGVSKAAARGVVAIPASGSGSSRRSGPGSASPSERYCPTPGPRLLARRQRLAPGEAPVAPGQGLPEATGEASAAATVESGGTAALSADGVSESASGREAEAAPDFTFAAGTSEGSLSGAGMGMGNEGFKPDSASSLQGAVPASHAAASDISLSLAAFQPSVLAAAEAALAASGTL